MNKRKTNWTIASVVAVCSVALVAVWPRHRPGPAPVIAVRPSTSPSLAVGPRVQGLEGGTAATQETTPTLTLRQQFQHATDYAQFVRDARSRALGGNAEAQYLTAKALRYCDETLSLYFKGSSGQVHTLAEIQFKWASRPAGISQRQLANIYSRCEGFLADSTLLTDGGTWEQWLNRASAAAYPAAEAQKALDLESSILSVSASSVHHPPPGVTEDEARKLAIAAVSSGDPEAIFLMSNWVRSSNERSADQTAALIGAWQILACQENYDCGSDSDWMLAVCGPRQQCVEDQTYTDYFQRQLGNQYDEAVSLASSIKGALATRDIPAIQAYL